MALEIKPVNRIKGSMTLPGDRALTFASMALGMCVSDQLKIINPFSDISSLRSFLEENGAVFENFGDGFILHGNKWEKQVTLGEDIPSEILHILSGTILGAGQKVVLDISSGKREVFARNFINECNELGIILTCEEENGNLLLEHTGVLPTSLKTSNPFAFEIIASLYLNSDQKFEIDCRENQVSHCLKICNSIGYNIAKKSGQDSRSAEIARRMAKAEGNAQEEKYELSPGKGPFAISIPGDTTIASVYAGAAAVLEGSSVKINGLLWEKSRRGFFETLRRMKCEVQAEKTRGDYSFDTADIKVKWNPLSAVMVTPVQAAAMPAEVEILAAISAFAEGETAISVSGADKGKHLKYSVLARGLERLGAHVGDYAEGVALRGGKELEGEIVECENDLPTALAFVIAGLRSHGKTILNGCGRSEPLIGEVLENLYKSADGFI